MNAPHCGICGRFVTSDDLILSGVLDSDTIYCPRCASKTAPAGAASGARVIAPAGVTEQGDE